MTKQSQNMPFSIAKNEWQVEIKICEGLKNPKWDISEKIANKIYKIFQKLPSYYQGIPNMEESTNLSCLVQNQEGNAIIAFGDFVVGKIKNVIEIKLDGLDTIKNEILRTCPTNLYRNLSYFLQDLRLSGVKRSNKRTGILSARNHKT